MNQFEIIVLANSVKHGQHCVAGKCLQSSQWVRPVANEQGAELSHEQAIYQNPYGTYIVKPLQKIRMGFTSHVPLMHQPENYLIDGSLWQQNYSVNINDLSNYLDSPVNLWEKGSRVKYTLIELGLYNINQSLYLIQVEQLNLYVTNGGRRRASFYYNRLEYDLPVTDPKFDNIIREQLEVKGILCISLGGEHNGYCYKLVATIF